MAYEKRKGVFCYEVLFVFIPIFIIINALFGVCAEIDSHDPHTIHDVPADFAT